ncbi:hypothetical protein L53_10695 [Hyphomonas sp. L-53-1-40]|jgi:hypothetical protein|uniref:hypothetical protein n=1 Tax=Hyphomonas sp. L-53-1-40 TaxID=1207058 RepID=UPI0004590B41|nr:hypothetical protein [Hyphomonas sp. L-53-1-40]KCZ62556.1 hypothetical protein L53_10695 [Hyphomonas sp. L-53-1-40]
MAFRERFDRYVCEGDSIACEVEGFAITARIVRDDCPDAPDQRQDGFWPSLYINDPGFIGPGSNFRARLAKAHAEAEAVMEAWRKDEWFYCGVVLAIECEGVELDDHAASLWGIEANYPESDNAYLSEVADELLPEALAAGGAALKRLMASAPAQATQA